MARCRAASTPAGAAGRSRRTDGTVPEKRRAMMGEAFAKVRDNVYLIPLHRQMIPWAVRANVKVHHRPDNVVEALWITVGK